ncbi:oxysterol-binding protein, putative [Plasmodium vivax]|uniref:Oxysterol-binding protein/PH domain containing protein n=6 Tax=Plasmodium vivax TaxID=5855 RepID=A5K4X7_PLAVS|nr:oxysterol-binding protein/PH domain containing protein [Plasmodium vivax]KMZ80282.1 oxysterol-binding protein/PH domain-containing protein [Plasmodium vivax India VII]KMZ86669.1 oxysterol-binding protein/PH domain-containing protein [Plasmodium vivax Brazil I]KMZ93119.1 oxysterol-binding protein/PH domain-containing protein [Plasmodium vivax Mauritania I]KMZ99579.1 oxysterol-binding protein/PH domain-containing protein [Plasmodium vivax North Korean]EDL45705.1 oxysterol-binding protein/PH d|eukprot:XP_001615432.1 oxysterol-binding protein/PH domain containing protein [Plasmodium vivax Sal-1]
MLGGKYLNLKLFSDRKNSLASTSAEEPRGSHSAEESRGGHSGGAQNGGGGHSHSYNRDKRIIHEGWLNKWTNIIGSYRPRYFVLENGILRYSIDKFSPTKETFGLTHCKIKVCPDDPLHFEIDTTEQGVLYLKADFPEDKHKWYISFKKAQLNYLHGRHNKKGCIDVNNFNLSTNSEFIWNIIKNTNELCKSRTVSSAGGEKRGVHSYSSGDPTLCRYPSGRAERTGKLDKASSCVTLDQSEGTSKTQGMKNINLDEVFISSTDFEDKSPTLCLMENIVSLKEITRDLIKNSQLNEANSILRKIKLEANYKLSYDRVGPLLYQLSNSIDCMDAVIEKYISCTEMLLKEENIQSKCMNKSLKLLAKQNYFLEKSQDKKGFNDLQDKVKNHFEKFNLYVNDQESEEEENEDMFFDCDDESFCGEKNEPSGDAVQGKDTPGGAQRGDANSGGAFAKRLPGGGPPEEGEKQEEEEAPSPEGPPIHPSTVQTNEAERGEPMGEHQEDAYTEGSAAPLDSHTNEVDETDLTREVQDDLHLTQLCTEKNITSLNFSRIDIYTDSKIKRRTKLPSPRTDIKISMWSLLKDCIGKDLSRIGMPIYLNEPSSFLQRLAEDFQYVYLLQRASREVESTSRLAYVTAFTISPYASVIGRTFKPFNPLLGETYELTHRKFFFVSEQVVHHPPITAYHCHNEYMRNFASITVNVQILGKSVEVTIPGSSHLILRYQKGGSSPTGGVQTQKNECSPLDKNHIFASSGEVNLDECEVRTCASTKRNSQGSDTHSAHVIGEGANPPKGTPQRSAPLPDVDPPEYGHEHYTYQRANMIIHNIIFGKLWVELHGNILIRNHNNGDFSIVSYIRKGWFDKEIHKVRAVVCDRYKNVIFYIYGKWSQEINIAYVKHLKKQEYGSYFFNADGSENINHFNRNTLNEFISNVDWQFYENQVDALNGVCVWKAPKRPKHSELYYGFNNMTVELNEITPEYDPSKGAAIACTDSRFRPDQRSYENGNIEIAMSEKQRLENKQRANSKKYAGKKDSYKPKWFYKHKDPIYKDRDMYLFNNEYWVAKEKGLFTDAPDIF